MTTLTIDNLLYEEVVMLQDIMVMLSNTDFTNNLDVTEREIFEDLYNKVINA
jgi:hypothetical protein